MTGGPRGEVLVPGRAGRGDRAGAAEGRLVVDAGTRSALSPRRPRTPPGAEADAAERRCRLASAGARSADGRPSPTDAAPGVRAARDDRSRLMRIDVITLFPGIFPGPLAESIPGRALERGLAELHAHDLREWGLGRHRSVDDYPYGGGAGMVLRPEPIAAALDALAPPGSEAFRILLDPGGERVRAGSRAWTSRSRPHLVCVCPRYEGVDERVRSLVDLELSIGDYVVSGGEIPALVGHRRRPAPAARCHRRGLDGRGVVLARAARVPAVHATAGLPGHGRARRS